MQIALTVSHGRKTLILTFRDVIMIEFVDVS